MVLAVHVPLHIALLGLAFIQFTAPAAGWLQGDRATNQPIWGLDGGLRFALPFTNAPDPMPRGLIRLYAPVGPEAQNLLVNFLAIEPIVHGHRGFSELERSALEQRRGKRLWALGPSKVTRLGAGIEELSVTVGVEAFDNGARVELELSQRSDLPDELQIRMRALANSSKIDQCVLTATMGNLVRTRRLWLENEVVHSQDVFAGYRGSAFTAHRAYDANRMLRVRDSFLVAVTGDEEDPAAVFPFPDRRNWHYAGKPVTQYWRKPVEDKAGQLKVAVNGRYTYWMSERPIPGGLAFENFELWEPFDQGHVVVFGITIKTPRELGFAVAAQQQ